MLDIRPYKAQAEALPPGDVRTAMLALIDEVDSQREELRTYRCDPGHHTWTGMPAQSVGGTVTDPIKFCEHCGAEYEGD